jgi:hypothetical protein
LPILLNIKGHFDVCQSNAWTTSTRSETCICGSLMSIKTLSRRPSSLLRCETLAEEVGEIWGRAHWFPTYAHVLAREEVVERMIGLRSSDREQGTDSGRGELVVGRMEPICLAMCDSCHSWLTARCIFNAASALASVQRLAFADSPLIHVPRAPLATSFPFCFAAFIDTRCALPSINNPFGSHTIFHYYLISTVRGSSQARDLRLQLDSKRA